MDKLQLLERYYNSFINLENPKDFFEAFAEYIEFIDQDPELDGIVEELFLKRKEYEERVEKLQPAALKKLEIVKNELAEYISKNKIEAPIITESFKEYDGWLTGHIFGSSSLPRALHLSLTDILMYLYGIPEYKGFAAKYAKFYKDHKEVPQTFLSVKEFDEYFDAEIEMKSKYENELWGKMLSIIHLYQVMKRGKKQYKELLEESKKTRSSKPTYEMLNLSLPIGEWDAIERGNSRDIVFYKPEKVRQTLVRFQNYLLTRYSKSHFQSVSETQNPKPEPPPSKEKVGKIQPILKVEENAGYLKFYKEGPKIGIGATKTRKYRLLEVLIEPLGVAKTIDVVFDAIKTPKDSQDSRLNNNYTAPARKKEIIDYALKELQKVEGLKGKIHLEYINNGKSVYLALDA